GYSLWEMQVYGTPPGGTPTPTVSATPSPTATCVAVSARVTPMPAPTGVTATAGNAQVTVAWPSYSATHDGMWVLRATTSGGPFAQIADVIPPTSSYTNTGLTNGTTYYYKIQAHQASPPEWCTASTFTSAQSVEVSAVPQA